MKRMARNALWLIAAMVVAIVGFRTLDSSTGSTPSADKHGQEHGAEGHSEGRVKLSDAKIAAAGIELVKAAPGTLYESVLLNGILQPNQETLAQVTPRFPGIVRELNKRIGDRVEKNELLGKIESNQSLTVYELRAPFAGTIIERNAALGEFASEQKPAFIIADLSTVWADFAVPRRDLGRVQAGNTVVLSTDDGLPPMEAKLSYVAPVGNADTQTALARAVVPNDRQRLRPGLFVTGRVRLTEQPATVAVKLTALQTLENRTVVFVRSGEEFEAREVELGNRDAKHAEVLFGLEAGDIYAAKNSFVIKAEIGKGSADHEH